MLSLFFLSAAVLFILSIRGLSSPKTANRGNVLGILGMILVIAGTLFSHPEVSLLEILLTISAGASVAFLIVRRIAMTALPQLMAAFHSLVGLAAVLIGSSAFLNPLGFNLPTPLPSSSALEMGLGVIIGALTFTGSCIAFGKLQGLLGSAPLVFKGQRLLNAILILACLGMLVLFCQNPTETFFWSLPLLGALLGLLLILPIGGADMPVIVSMLNSYSGWAACGIGFTLNQEVLVITGALVGASGAILSHIMCKGMNRSLLNVILGGFGGENSTQRPASEKEVSIKTASAEDAAFILENAQSVVIVPGYGMAVAQAQHALKDLVDHLKEKGVKVRFAIHPVAGRMPGHMNVLLAEADIPYEDIIELEDINPDFAATDAVLVIGANDITNPAARTDPQSPIYGMPILDVDKARTVLFIKRSMAPGYAGVENTLFGEENTFMVFGDAKKVTEGMVKALG